MDWFNDLCRKTTTGEIAASLLESRGMLDVTELLAKVGVPTLVLHAREDAGIPISEGRLLAAGIPWAQFVELDSKNHILLENEGAWIRFCEAVLEFTGIEHFRRADDSGIRFALPARTRDPRVDHARTG